MSHSIRPHEGYIMIDHRNSPGIPADTANKVLGIDSNLVGEGKMLETSTMHCAHCGTVVITNPGRTRERASCYPCGSYICDNCGIESRESGYVHRPYRQRLESYLQEVIS